MKKIAAMILATGAMLALAGCSAEISMDPRTGVVEIDGLSALELQERYDLPDTFEVSIDQKTGEVTIDGVSVKDLGVPGKTRDRKSASKNEEESEDEDRNFDEEEESQDTASVDEEGVKETFTECGVELSFPEEFYNIDGVVDMYSYEAGYNLDAYMVDMSYIGVAADWYNDLLDAGDYSDEDLEKIASTVVDLPSIMCMKTDRNLGELVDTLKKKYEFRADKKDFEKIKDVGEYSYYVFYDDKQDNMENLDQDFRKEYDKLVEIADKAIDEGIYNGPTDIYEEVVGSKLKFKTEDLDGNKIKSKDIFSENKITMLNLWATWCGNCLDELPELAELNEKLKEKDCAVVGILGDGHKDGKVEVAKDILKDAGADYLNILPWEGALGEDLVIPAWPITYFVDSNGVIIGRPVVGMELDEYLPAIESLLKEMDESSEATDEVKDKEDEKGNAADKSDNSKTDNSKTDSSKIDKSEDTAKDKTAAEAKPNSLKQYRVYVIDPDGNAVKDVQVQLCDDSTCRVENTDKDGLAAFKVDKAKYEVHILSVPEEYKEVTEVFTMPGQYSDITITLEPCTVP